MAQNNDLRIAVLLTYEAQMLDMAGIDLFGMMSKEYMAVAMPKPIVDIALNVKIFYAGKDSAESDSSLRALTAQAAVKADVSVDADEVQPGNIDILLIPGPPPGEKQSAKTLDFVRAHGKHGTITLVVCTGAFVAAEAGVLDGRKASGPRALVPRLRKEYPAVSWDDTRRFVKDVKQVGDDKHEIWSSGGICNGLEMVAAYLREKYPGPLSEAVCAMADVGEKGEFYDTTVGVDNAWWLGQILRAFFFGQRRSGPAKQ